MSIDASQVRLTPFGPAGRHAGNQAAFRPQSLPVQTPPRVLPDVGVIPLFRAIFPAKNLFLCLLEQEMSCLKQEEVTSISVKTFPRDFAISMFPS